MTRPAFLAALRRSTGLSQAQVAERLGVTPQAVSVWETSETTEPRSSTYASLLDLYGASPALRDAFGRHLVNGGDLPDVAKAEPAPAESP